MITSRHRFPSPFYKSCFTSHLAALRPPASYTCHLEWLFAAALAKASRAMCVVHGVEKGRSITVFHARESKKGEKERRSDGLCFKPSKILAALGARPNDERMALNWAWRREIHRGGLKFSIALTASRTILNSTKLAGTCHTVCPLSRCCGVCIMQTVGQENWHAAEFTRFSLRRLVPRKNTGSVLGPENLFARWTVKRPAFVYSPVVIFTFRSFTGLKFAWKLWTDDRSFGKMICG